MLSGWIEAISSGRKTLTVFNDDEPEPLVRMLRRMVDSPAVEVRAGDSSGDTPDNAVVVEDEDGELAVSSIGDISTCVLLVNADLYVTGTRPVDEVETPAALRHLDEIPFTVTGKQKMLFIELSRYVESLGWRANHSTVHAGFQFLSRIDDERGTRRVYDRLADSDSDVRLYGVPDHTTALPEAATVCTEPRDALRESWFVVNTDCADEMAGAFLAERTRPGEWRGCWTFDAERADAVSRMLRRSCSQ